MEFLYLLESIRTPFLDAVLSFLSHFGEETAFMLVAMILFWCVNKRCGYFLLYLAMLGTGVNNFLKVLFCVPRPWIRDENFTIVESAREQATGYSFPSGHTQTAGGLYLGIARQYHCWPLRIGMILLTLLVAFSRMYLGVHTPADVLVSLGLATLMVLGASPLFHRAWNKSWKWYIPLFAALFAVCIGQIVYLTFFPMPAHAQLENTANGMATAYKMTGASIGLLITVWLDTRYLHFDTKAVWWAQILKVFLGLAILIAIQKLTKTPLLALTGGHDGGNLLRYLFLFLFGGVVWPLTFRFLPKPKEKAPGNSSI